MTVTRPLPSFLLSLILLTGAFVEARTCDAVFSGRDPKLAGDLLNTRTQGAQRFLRLMRGGLMARYRLNPEVAQLAHDLSLLEADRATATHQIQWPDAVGSIRKNLRGTTLSYTIPSLVVTQNGTGLPLGTRPPGLNSLFSKVLVGLMEAVRLDLQRNPSIDRVEMVAGSVVNMDLVGLLKQSGFIQVGGDRSAPSLPPGRRPPPDVYVHQTPGGPFMRGMGLGMGMGMDPTFSSWAHHGNPDRGKSWVHHFDVTR